MSEFSKAGAAAHARPGRHSDPFAERVALLEDASRLPPGERQHAIESLIRDTRPAIREGALRLGASVLPDASLIRMLRDGADDRLRNAAVSMAKMRGGRGLKLALDLLNDRDADVVLQAVVILDHFRDPTSLGSLRPLLRHSNANVAQAAIVAIGGLGHDGAAADLLPFLEGDLWLKIAAVQALGHLRAKNAIKPLSRLLDDPMLGSFVAEALTRIGGASAFRVLCRAWLATGSPSDDLLKLLAHVAEGLSRAPKSPAGFQAALKGKLTSDDESVQRAAARCCLALGPGPNDAEALDVMTHAGAPDVPVCMSRRKDLIGTLLAQRGTLRRWGYLLAASYPAAAPPQAVGAALRACHGAEHADVIAAALPKLRSPGLADAILDHYLQLPGEARAAWGPVLAAHRTALRQALDRRTDLTMGARDVLATVLADSPAAIIAKLTDLPPDARARALTQLLDHTAVMRRLPWVAWLEQDPGTYGPLAAQVAEKVDFRPHLPALRKLLVREPTPYLLRIIARVGDRDSARLLAELAGRRDPGLQPFVLSALGELGGENARQALRRVVAAGDHHARIAHKALAACAVAEDLPIFVSAAGHADWYVRLTAARALVRLGNDDHLPILAQLASDPIPVVAQGARAALEL